MTDWRPVGWALLALGLLNSVWGAYELGAGGENVSLLVTGISCLTIWLVLHDEFAADDAATTGGGQEGSA